MDTISVNKFRDNLKSFVEQVIREHLPLKVTRRSGDDFVVLRSVKGVRALFKEDDTRDGPSR